MRIGLVKLWQTSTRNSCKHENKPDEKSLDMDQANRSCQLSRNSEMKFTKASLSLVRHTIFPKWQTGTLVNRI